MRHARVGQPAPARPIARASAGPRTNGALALEHGADVQLRRLQEVREEHAAHRLRVLRRVEQRRRRCCPSRSTRHCRLWRFRGETAQADAAGLLDQSQHRVAPRTDWRVSARFRAVQLRQRDTARRHSRVHQLRHVGRRPRPPAGPSCTAHSRTTFTADATWTGFSPLALAVGYTRNGSGYDYRIFESTGEDVRHVYGRCRRQSVGDVPRSVSRSPTEAALASTRRSWCRSASSRRFVTTTSPTGRVRSSAARSTSSRHEWWMLSASAGVRQGRLRRQLLRTSGSVVPHLRLGRRLSAARTASAAAAATTTSATPGSNLALGVARRAGGRSAPRLDD